MTYPPQFQLPSPYPASGDIVDGKYRVERILGEGGMGAVAKAMHLLRRAPVALKFMSPAAMSMPDAVARFLNESVAASRIDSDHVVNIYDVGQLKTGAPYLVMEFLEGLDLSELLVRDGRPGIDIARAVHFALQALRGLQVAHATGIVHRDMKPSNCFVLYKDGEPDFLKVLDFGISKVAGAYGGAANAGRGALTATNSALGTPLYMSPEQARSPRDVDLRTDLYAVGVILYELLTGRTPFHSESGELTEILFKIFTAEPPHIRTFRPDLPDALAEVVHKAMSRERDQRFGSARAMAEALGPWSDSRSHTVLHRLVSYTGVGSRPPPPMDHESPVVVVTPAQLPVFHGGVSSPPPPPARDLMAAAAQTHLSTESNPPPPPVQRPYPSSGQTAAGLSRDARTGSGLDRRSLLFVGVPALLLVVAAAVGAGLAFRARHQTAGPDPSVTSDPARTTTTVTASGAAFGMAGSLPSTSALPTATASTAIPETSPRANASASTTPKANAPKTTRESSAPSTAPKPTFREPSQINP